MQKYTLILLSAIAANTAEAVVVSTPSGVTVTNGNDLLIDIDGDSINDLQIQNVASAAPGTPYQYIAAVTPTNPTGGFDSTISASEVAINPDIFGLSLLLGGATTIQSASSFSDTTSALGVTTGFTSAPTYLAGSFAFADEIADANWVNSAAVNSPSDSIVNALLAVRFESSLITGSPVIYNGFVDVSFNNRTFNNQVITVNSFGFENQIPEPSSVLLFSLATLGLLRRKR